MWGDRRGSNSRHPEPQSGALPTELRPPWHFRQDLIPTRRPFKSPPGDFSSPVFTFTTETYESFYLHSQDRATLSRPHRTALPCFVHKLKGSGDYPIIGVELPAKTHHFTQASTPWFIYTGYLRHPFAACLLRRHDLRQRLCSYHSDQLCMAESSAVEAHGEHPHQPLSRRCPILLGLLSIHKRMELVVGLEPTADRLQIYCATIAPHQHQSRRLF